MYLDTCLTSGFLLINEDKKSTHFGTSFLTKNISVEMKSIKYWKINTLRSIRIPQNWAFIFEITQTNNYIKEKYTLVPTYIYVLNQFIHFTKWNCYWLCFPFIWLGFVVVFYTYFFIFIYYSFTYVYICSFPGFFIFLFLFILFN